MLLEHIHESFQHRAMKLNAGQDRNRAVYAILKIFKIQRIDSYGELPNTRARWFDCNVDVLHRFERFLTHVMSVTLKLNTLNHYWPNDLKEKLTL